MFYYVELDTNGIVLGIIEEETNTMGNDTKILVGENFENALNLIGQVYRDGKFMPVQVRTMLLVEEMYAMQTN